GDSSHLQATHQMIGGQYNRERTQTASPVWPSHGSIVSSVYGPNNDVGVPTYVQQGRIDGDGAAWLGSAFKPFDPSRRENLVPQTEISRFRNRFATLERLDRNLSGQELPEGWTEMKRQAFSAIVGEARLAFEIEQEPQEVQDMYGTDAIGKQLLMARRLVEYGSKYVTVHYGGWDMHQNIADSLPNRVGPIDRALSALIKDVWDLGLNDQVMIIVTSEFGRTSLNPNVGRDHWPRLTSLLMSGGQYEMNRAIGTND
ncbi:MAG: DUF1501 domain-containing protein, partial [Candidatus Dadabacteria bacterium]|nr:DUF1501 domain-containing protein [Candidatus Dadabacteria bacterium]